MSTSITAQRYNDLRTLVNKILGVSDVSTPDYGYGQAFTTSPVVGDFDANPTTVDKITAEQYEQLYFDLIRIRVHQIGAAATTINPYVEGGFETNPSADKIEESYIQSLETLAANIETDRFLIDFPTQASETTLKNTLSNPIVSTRSNSQQGNWNGTLTHIVKVTFADAATRRHFFNAGGEIRFTAEVDYAGSQRKAVDWQDEMAAMGTISFRANETVSNNAVGTGFSVGSLNLTSTYQLCYDKSGGSNYIRNHYYIDALQLNDREIQFRIRFLDGRPNDLTWGIDEPVEGDFTSRLFVLQPDGQATINGTATDTVIIPTNDLPSGENISNL